MLTLMIHDDRQNFFSCYLSRHEATLAAVLRIIIVTAIVILDDEGAVYKIWTVITSMSIHVCHSKEESVTSVLSF